MTDRTPTFCLIGAAGFVDPRHVDAIHAVGGRLVGAVDPSDSLGVLDRYGEPVEVFSAIGPRWENWMRRRRKEGDPVDWVAVATPNDLHVPHAIAAMGAGADVICEKPLSVFAGDLDSVEMTERRTGRRTYVVLQMRENPVVERLRAPRHAADVVSRASVDVTYVTPRGPWYDASWKGQDHRSGGLALNIGVHLFDLLLHVYGPALDWGVDARGDRFLGGQVTFRDADVRWFLSTDPKVAPGGRPRRVLRADGVDYDLSEGFGTGHAAIYRRILAGNGWGVADARPAIALARELR